MGFYFTFHCHIAQGVWGTAFFLTDTNSHTSYIKRSLCKSSHPLWVNNRQHISPLKFKNYENRNGSMVLMSHAETQCDSDVRGFSLFIVNNTNVAVSLFSPQSSAKFPSNEITQIDVDRPCLFSTLLPPSLIKLFPLHFCLTEFMHMRLKMENTSQWLCFFAQPAPRSIHHNSALVSCRLHPAEFKPRIIKDAVCRI